MLSTRFNPEADETNIFITFFPPQLSFEKGLKKRTLEKKIFFQTSGTNVPANMKVPRAVTTFLSRIFILQTF